MCCQLSVLGHAVLAAHSTMPRTFLSPRNLDAVRAPASIQLQMEPCGASTPRFFMSGSSGMTSSSAPWRSLQAETKWIMLQHQG